MNITCVFKVEESEKAIQWKMCELSISDIHSCLETAMGKDLFSDDCISLACSMPECIFNLDR